MTSSRFRFPTRKLALVAALGVPILLVRAEEEKKPETNVAVHVAKVVRTTLRSYVIAYGTAEAAPAAGVNQPAGGARLAAATAGLIVAVPGVEGARVEKGAVIAQLDARSVDAAVKRAQAAVTAADKARSRQTQLQAADGTSERALQDAAERLAAARGELAAARLLQSHHAIRAPIAGILARVSVKPGEWLDAGKEVAEVVDPARLVIEVQVPAVEALALQVGQVATVYSRLGATETATAQASVQFISPRIAPGTDNVLVRLAPSAESSLRAGQFLVARIVTSERANRLAVPRESVYTDHDGQTTLSIVEGDVAKQKVVKAGLRDGPLVEVEGEGVSEGATVVTLGSYALPRETKVRVIAGKEAAK